MAVKYDFYETPDPGNGTRKSRYHVRAVSLGTVGTARLASEIHDRCSLTESDVRAVLSELSKVAVEHLRNGERIQVDGLGYFQMTLECPQINTMEEIRAESIRFKSVAFRAEIELKQELRKSIFERVPVKHHSKEYSGGEMDKELTEYFAENEFLTRPDLERKCHCTRSTAIRHINRLLREGKIVRKGNPRFPVYQPAPGNYGKP